MAFIPSVSEQKSESKDWLPLDQVAAANSRELCQEQLIVMSVQSNLQAGAAAAYCISLKCYMISTPCKLYHLCCSESGKLL